MITSRQLRQKYIDFYLKRGHQQIPSAPLVPENDPSTLFTSSGMQPLIPYLLGQPHPLGTRLVNSQKSFRAQDIDEVGDNRHTTFFEMLGNWSLGDYFKKEQLPWFFEFLTEEIGLEPERLYVSVFNGDENIKAWENNKPQPLTPDVESAAIWKNIFSSVGIDARKDDRIVYYSAQKNWWSRSGTPGQMPAGEPGGPDSEVFYDFGPGLKLHEKSKWKDEPCHPNCDCGRFLEIGNSVFMQYQKQSDGTLKELPKRNVDFGGGLERILAALNKDPDIFKTDLFSPVIETIQQFTGKNYRENAFEMRVIADHLKGATMLVTDGVIPSNKAQGYMLRRLIRRAAVKMKKLTDKSVVELSQQISLSVGQIYRDVYLDPPQTLHASAIIGEEVEKFDRVLHRGLKEITKHEKLDGKIAFDLLQTYGFPWELTFEIASELGHKIDPQEFQREFAKHQELSRSASKGMFKGGLQDQSETVVRYHTATHLLHKALREILGPHVQQKGSNITAERLRFDFSHSEKLTPGQLAEVEALVNQKIAENLPVVRQEMPKSQALAQGALAFFPEKYPEITSVYTIGQPDNWYSKELCGGPHVNSTGEIGGITITKEESAGAGTRRIYAQLSRLA